MSRSAIPSYRLHKATGQAVVVHKGKSFYLGKFGTPESHAAYDRVVADILAARNTTPSTPPSPSSSTPVPLQTQLLVSELVLRYWEYASGYYVKNGCPTGEHDPLRQALRLLRRHCGVHPVTTIGPLAIKELQDVMIVQPITRRVNVKKPDGSTVIETKVIRVGLSRRTINKQVGRIKRVFHWGVAEQLVPPDVYAAIRETPGLKKNRSTAREKPRVRPVKCEHFEAILPHVPLAIAAMAKGPVALRMSSARDRADARVRD